MDFRFKYSRNAPAPPTPEQQRRERREKIDNQQRLRGLAFGLSIPTMLAAGPISGWLVGSWLDRSFGTHFWLLSLILLGTFAGLASTIRMLSRLNR